MSESVDKYERVEEALVFMTRDIDGDPIPEERGGLKFVLGRDAMNTLEGLFRDSQDRRKGGGLDKQKVFIFDLPGVFLRPGFKLVGLRLPTKEELQRV